MPSMFVAPQFSATGNAAIRQEMHIEPILLLRPTKKLQNDCHSRAGGSPVQRRLDSRLRGNDG
jgi:hypothetical protein